MKKVNYYIDGITLKLSDNIKLLRINEELIY